MQKKDREKRMDTGKIFLGIALIAFSVAMGVHPASAASGDNSCPVGTGNIHLNNCTSAAGSLQYPEYTAHSDTTACCRIDPEMLPLIA